MTELRIELRSSEPVLEPSPLQAYIILLYPLMLLKQNFLFVPFYTTYYPLLFLTIP